MESALHSKIRYTVLPSKKAVIVNCPSKLCESAIHEYFLQVLDDESIPAGSTEYVDFTKVTDFQSSHDTFWTSKGLYARIAHEGRYVKTVFVVNKPLQYGMARMYCAMLEDTDNKFEITYDPKLIESLKSSD